MLVKETIFDEILVKRIGEIDHANAKLIRHSRICSLANDGRCSCRETVALISQISTEVIRELQRLRESEI